MSIDPTINYTVLTSFSNHQCIVLLAKTPGYPKIRKKVGFTGTIDIPNYICAFCLVAWLCNQVVISK